MAARVQSTPVSVNGTTGSFTASLTGVTPGNALIMSFSITDTQAPTAISDGTPWTFRTTPGSSPPWIDATGTGLNFVIMTAYRLNVPGGNTTVTVTLPASAATFANGSLGEYSGVGSFGSGITANPNNTANPATLGALTVAPGGLVVATIQGEFAQTGLTPIAPLTADPADTGGYTSFALISSSGPYTPSWNNTSPRTYAGIAAYFAPPAQPPAAPPAARDLSDAGGLLRKEILW